MNRAWAKTAANYGFFCTAAFSTQFCSQPQASEKLKQGVRNTIMRLEQRNAAGMIEYYRSAIIGTERSIGFAALMRQEGFDRFEEALEEFWRRFNDAFLRRP
jgi:hypothetical protein